MSIDITAVTLTELRYLVAVADQRHFGRAAAACSVTQPTLSAQLQKLETTLGVKLFERSSKSVTPTERGAEIIEQARVVLEATEKLLDVARSKLEPLSGRLRLGVIPTLGPYLLPWLVRPLQARFQRLELVFREVKTSELLEELAGRKLDAGILALPFDAGALEHLELFEEPFYVLAPRAHPLASRASVRESDLAGERVLLLDEGHCMRDQALAICSKARDPAGAATNGDFRATSIETLRHMVGAGMGLTLIPALALGEGANGAAQAVALPFAAPAPVRRMALAWRRTHPRRADFLALAEFVQAHLPDAVRGAREGARTRSARR
jgi:LysR family hydrogen peroxide-inducible transcriptional activator